MKSAIVCIAKNEDHYINEWIKYHLKLGFAKIFVYQNNWRYSGDKQQYNDTVEWIEFDGDYMQLKAYNDFIDNRREDFDFASFNDVDEFICLKKHANINDFLSNYTDVYGIGLSWRMFGDNGLTEPINNNYSTIDRFTRCGKKLNKHIKTILNLKMSQNMFHFVNPHFIDAALKFNVILDVDKKHFINGPFDFQASTEIAQINHYYCKTKAEFAQKIANGRADAPNGGKDCMRTFAHFDEANQNDIEDLTIKNFWNS